MLILSAPHTVPSAMLRSKKGPLFFAPLRHLLPDVDVVVRQHLFQDCQQPPALAVFVLFRLGRQESQRLVLVQTSSPVIDSRATVETDQVLHGEECSGTFVGIYPFLALGRVVGAS